MIQCVNYHVGSFILFLVTMRPISLKTTNLDLLIMIFFEPNLDIGRLVAKAGKPRNTILRLPKRQDVIQVRNMTLQKENNKNKNSKLTIQPISTMTKCVIVHYGFHQILNEFGHFYLVKLFNPLMNRDQLLQIMFCFINAQ